MGNEPAWTTHTTRLHPGGDVVVNRDDEEGDIGMQSHLHREKSREGRGSGSGGSDSSNTRADRLDMKDEDGSPDQMASDPPIRTPPLAVYREGHDLVLERRRKDTGGVDVDVEKGVFPTQEDKRNFDENSIVPDHKREEVAARGVPLERHNTNDSHSTNAASDGGVDDDDGYIRRRPYHWNESSSSPAAVQGTMSTRSGDRDPADIPTKPIHSYISADRLKKNKQPESGWKRFLRVGTSDSNNSAQSWAEEGRSADKEPAFLPARTHTNRSLSNWARAPTLEPPSHHQGEGIPLTRTLSRAVSFAPNLAPPSDTAPSRSNYGNAVPGFKKTPSLQMFRSTSLRADGDDVGMAGPNAIKVISAPSPADEEPNYGANAPGFKRNPGLSMFRTSSVRVDEDNDSGPSVSFQEPKKPT